MFIWIKHIMETAISWEKAHVCFVGKMAFHHIGVRRGLRLNGL